MRLFLLLLSLLTIFSCDDSEKESDSGYYIVETEVMIKEGKIKEVLDLFKSTNPELVAGERDWMKASFSKVEGKNIVVVRAYWKKKLSYLKFSSTEEFRNTMKDFSQFFESRPKVTVSKVLFTM